MNRRASLASLLAAASIGLIGCNSNPPRNNGWNDGTTYQRDPSGSSASSDQFLPPLPRTPETRTLEQTLLSLPQPARKPINQLTKQETIDLYESMLPSLHDSPIPQIAQDIETAIRNRYHVSVRGAKDITSLQALQTALCQMPHTTPCTVYIIPDTLNLTERYSVAGWYKKGPLPHIILLGYSARYPETATHEFAHAYDALLGDAFTREWNALNKYAYGAPSKDKDGRSAWNDGQSDARYGFANAYANTSEYEDRAVLTQKIRDKELADLIRNADQETCTILTAKTRLLEREQFISPAESQYAQTTLAQRMGTAAPRLHEQDAPILATQPTKQATQTTTNTTAAILLAAFLVYGAFAASSYLSARTRRQNA